MAKISSANAVPNAIETACQLFRVRCYRMNSRAFQVVGAGGRQRPMFIGQWRDRLGVIHHSGMSDLLLTPLVTRVEDYDTKQFIALPIPLAIALWVECKAGTGSLRTDQKLFRDDILASGSHYLEAHDSADQVIAWFNAHGVVGSR
jgi:hypothetical protein